MADCPLPEPRLEYPGLLQPNHKSCCPVTVDWDHKMARGLVLAVDCATARDLMGDSLTKPNGLVRAVTTAGEVANFNGTNDYISTSVDFAGVTTVSAGTLMLVGISYTTTSNLVITEKGSNRAFATQTFSGGVIRGSITDLLGAGPLDTSSGWNDGLPHNYLLTGNTAGLQAYVDGSVDGTTTFSGSTSGSGNALYIGSRAGSFVFPGQLAYVFIWNNRTMTADEARDLTNNPYQFLIPA